MIFAIDNYGTSSNSQPLYLHASLNELDHTSHLFNFHANSIFDAFDSIKPNCVITSISRVGKDLLLYLQECEHKPKLILNIDNTERQQVEQFLQFLKHSSVPVEMLITSDYDLDNKLVGVRVLKMPKAADINQISSLDFNFNINTAFIVDAPPEQNSIHDTSSFHVISTDEKLTGKVDYVINCLGLRSLFPKYNQIVFIHSKDTDQAFFDAIHSGSKVYYKNPSEKLKSKINKILGIDVDLDYDSDSKLQDFQEIKNIVDKKHTGYNRTKTMLSQIKGVQ